MADDHDPILVVDDDQGMRDLLTIALTGAGYRVVAAGSAEEALARLEEGRISLVLLDNQLPGMTGQELVTKIRQAEGLSTLPVVMVAAAARANHRVRALEAGADDYLVKPIRITELLARVAAHLRRHDAWTSVHTQRIDRRAAVMRSLCDVPVGVVRETADEVCQLLVDAHAHVGVIVFPEDGGALTLAARGLLTSSLRRPAVPPAVARALHDRASRGPWMHRPEDTATDLGDRPLACAPLYASSDLVGVLVLGTAADAGPDAAADVLGAAIDYAAIVAHLLAPGLPELGRRDVRLRVLEAILRDRSFEPVFQPIIDLDTERAVGYEALTRFHNGIRPDLVFAEAQAVGIGTDLEMATIAAVLDQAGRLPSHAWVSVNVSPTTICDDMFRRQLEGYSGLLVLELTEHDRVEDYELVRRSVRGFADNVWLSVDDAGSGFASLQHILELDPDYIKLDRSWISGIDQDVARQALVAGLGHFSDRFGCTMIAEGIETESELATLRELSAPLGQGFLLGLPASI